MPNSGNIATISGNVVSDSGIDLSTKADLVNGLIPSTQLPSYVDDILEFANQAAFPATGETGKIYVALDNNKIFRWSGSTYIEISPVVGISGTTNYVSKFTSASALGNSLIYDNDTNIGIGTTSPSQRFHVQGAAGENQTLVGIYSGTNTSRGLTIGLSVDGVANDAYVVYTSTVGSGYGGHRWVVDGAERMRITAAGNLGIGTTSPEGKLHVYGTASRNMFGVSSIALPTSGDEEGVGVIKTNSTLWQLSLVGYDTNSKGLRVYNTGGYGNTSLQVVQAGGTRFIVDGFGNVGIGTTAPNQKLEVAGIGRFTGTSAFSIGGDGGNPRIQYDSSGTIFGLLTGGDTFAALRTRAISVGASYGNTAPPVSGMIVEGSVGIGTSSPGYKFHVYNTPAFSSSGNIATFLNNTVTVPASSTFNNGGVWSSFYSVNPMTYAGSSSVSNGAIVAGNVNVNWVAFSTINPTITINQAGSGVRAMAGMQVLQQTGGTYNGTVTHGASLFIQGVYATNTANITYSNYYGLLINSLDEWGGVTLTNRWGIYQGGANDNNYFAAKVGIGTNAPTQALDVVGAVRMRGALYDVNNSAGTSGQVLGSTGSGVDWINVSEISGISGTGTANYVGKYTGTSTLGNSLIYDNGSNVIIGSTSANSLFAGSVLRLQVSGGSNSSNTLVHAIEALGGAAAEIVLITGDASNNRRGALRFYSNQVSSTTAQWVVGASMNQTAGDSGFYFRNASNSSVLALSQSKVFVNTESDAGAYALQVNGTTYSSNYYLSANTGLLLFGTSSSTNPYIQGDASNNLYFGTSNTARITVKSTGEVGIGTTSPTNTVQLGTTSVLGQDANTFYLGVNFKSNDQYITSNYALQTYYDQSTGNTVFRRATSGTANNSISWVESMRITSTGNVGIGTTAPSAKLHLKGSDGASVLRIDSHDGLYYMDIVASAYGGTDVRYDFKITDYGGLQNAAAISILGHTGYVGIGTTSPAVNLHISASGAAQRITDATSNNSIIIQAGSTSSNKITGYNYTSLTAVPLYISVDGANTILQSGGGNVGVGTTSPNFKLETVTANSGGISTPLRITNNANASLSTGQGVQIGFANDVGWGSNNASVIRSATTNVNNGAAALSFHTYDGSTLQEYMRITSAGNVGIGVTSPVHRITLPNDTFISFNNDALNPFGIGGGDNAMTRIVMGSASGASASIQFGIGTSGLFSGFTSLMTIKPSGNVGIGTTSPTDKFEVQDGYISTYHNANSNQAGYGIQFYTNGGGSKNTIASISPSQVSTNRSANLLFSTSNSGAPAERMRITSDGNVGIGTASPNRKLTVSATANDWGASIIAPSSNELQLSGNITGYNNGPSIRAVTSGSAAYTSLTLDGEYIDFRYSGTIGARLSGSGEFLIGTTTDAGDYKLQVAGNTYANGNLSVGTTLQNARVHVVGTTTTDGLYVSSGNTSSHYVAFFRNHSESLNIMAIKADGNVGIGTTSPGFKTHISAPRNTTGLFLEFNDRNTTGDYSQIGFGFAPYTVVTAAIRAAADNPYTSYNANLTFHTYNSGLQQRMVINSDGNVGIGTTTPQVKAHIAGDLKVGSGSQTGLIGLGDNSGVSSYVGIFRGGAGTVGGDNWMNVGGYSGIAFTTGETGVLGSQVERMRVTYGGNVGIGTTNPSTKLEVNSSFAINGLKTYVSNVLSADATQAKQYEILRGFFDYNDWGLTGTVEIEIQEYYYSRGITKKYIFAYGYYDSGTLYLDSMSGTGDNHFQLTIGSKTLVSGDIYYYPIYLQVKYYSQCKFSIRTVRPITTNNASTSAGDLYINTSPTGTNISDFTADSKVFPNYNAGTTVLSGNVGIGAVSPTLRLVVAGQGTGLAQIGDFGFGSGNYTGISLNGGTSTANYNILSSPTDANLYINRPSGGAVKFREANGFDHLTITSGGNVGIGTAAPDQRLSVFGGISQFAYNADNIPTTIRIHNDNVNQEAGIRFRSRDASGNNVHADISLKGTGGSDVGYIGFKVPFNNTAGSGYKMIINSSGNVGIGTTSPIGKLNIVSDIVNATTINTLLQMGYNTGLTNRSIVFQQMGNLNHGSQYLFLNGSLGSSSNHGTGSGNTIYLSSDYTSAFGFESSDNIMSVITSASAGTNVAGVRVMSFKGDGNVGIGDTAPGYKLTVNQATSGEIAYFGTPFINASSRNGLVILQSGTIPQDGSDKTGEVGLIFKFAYGTGGNNGNSNGGFIKAIRESVFSTTSNVNTAITFATASANTNSEKMRITSDGNVGIGTTSPTYKLHIPGTAGGDYAYIAQTVIGVDGNGTMIYPTNGKAITIFGQDKTGYLYGCVGSSIGKWAFNTASNINGSVLGINGNVSIGASYTNTAAPSNGLMVEGEVLIGTTTDSGNYKLQVGGDMYSTGSITTAAPSGGTARPWKFGEAGVSIGGSTGSAVRVEINGTVYYLMTGYLP